MLSRPVARLTGSHNLSLSDLSRRTQINNFAIFHNGGCAGCKITATTIHLIGAVLSSTRARLPMSGCHRRCKACLSCPTMINHSNVLRRIRLSLASRRLRGLRASTGCVGRGCTRDRRTTGRNGWRGGSKAGPVLFLVVRRMLVSLLANGHTVTGYDYGLPRQHFAGIAGNGGA